MLGSLAPILLLYSAYYWGTSEDTSLTLRYFLPVLPLTILSALWLLSRIADRRVLLACLALLLAIHVPRSVIHAHQAILEEWIGLARRHAVTTAVMDAVPPGSVLIARREILEFLVYYGQWRLVDDLNHWPGAPGPVFWLGDPETVSGFSDMAGGGATAHPLGEVTLTAKRFLLPYWVPRGPLVLHRLRIRESTVGKTSRSGLESTLTSGE